MSKAAVSVLIFGIYVMSAGLLLIVVPDFVARVFFIDPPADEWARFLGAVVTILGFYYIYCARTEATGFFRATLYGRPGALVAAVAFVMLGYFKPGLILVGVIDTCGAIWTWWALRQDARHAGSAA
jgi:hypothetical protein